MLDKIIHFSIHNKLIIGIFTLAWILWGGYSLTQLPIDAVPDITNNQVQIITYSPSLAAQEVERLITFPIELTMATISRIDEMRSISRFGLSVVTIVFKEDVDVFWARNQVFERLQQAQQKIPKGVGSPELMPITTGLGEIYQYVIRPKKGYEGKYSLNELRTIQDWIVRRQMLGTEGVADVSSFGGYVKQYEIAVNPEKLRSMNLTINDLFAALEKNNQNTGGSYIDKRPTAYFIRTEGLVGSLEDIENIVVSMADNGLPVFIRDIAKVQFGNAVRYGAMTRNSEGEVVGGIVMMLKGENSSKVIAKVKERMLQIEKTLPEGVVVEAFLDRTKLVNSAIKTVGTNLLEGALIVIFVLVLMLGNLRAGLVVASVIPLALLFAIMMMNLFGVSGNLMSLGAIDFGLIVDGAVIIVEATLHHLYNRPTLPSPKERVINLSSIEKGAEARLTQGEMDNEVYLSAVKIRTSAAFGEIIIMIVYLPLLTLVGIEGKMFKPMAQTVAFAILGAFILSITYVPMVSALLLSKNISHKVTISDRIIAFCYKFYKPLIESTLRRPLVIIFASVLLFVLSLGVFRTLGGEFIPKLDEGDFALEVRLYTGSSLDETVNVSLQMGKILKENFPEVKEVIGKIGAAEIPTDPMPLEACDMMVTLKDKSEWTSAKTKAELVSKMQAKLDEGIAGVSIGFQQPIEMRFNELMTGARQDVVLKIYGEDLEILSQEADKLAKAIQPVEGVADLFVEKVIGLPQIVVSFDREKIAQFGLSIEEANRMLNIAFAGSAAGTVYEGDRRYDLVVRLAKENRQNIEDVRNLFITNAKNEQIPLSQMADISFKTGTNQVQREDAKRRIIVAFNVGDRDVESIVGEIQQKVEKQLKLPTGYYITYGGSFENLQKAKARLLVAVPVALGLIFMLLYFTFHSIRQSLLIFSAIPLSAIGGIFALWLRDMPFSISAGVGFIALFGVSVLNGIVLIAEFNFLKDNGVSSVGTQTTKQPTTNNQQPTTNNQQSTINNQQPTTNNQQLTTIIMEGVKTRLRPILMTAAVASLGFLPMAISQGAGGEVQKPLATVVIGGLLSATFLTLFVLPALYFLVERFFEKKKIRTSMPTIFSILLLAFLGILFPQITHGQSVAVKKLTLETAIQESLVQNLSIKAGNYEIDLSKAMRKTATDMGKTSVLWQAGQYNSLNFDNSFSINQTMPLFVWNKQAQQLQAQVRSSELKLAVTQNELTYQVKIAYYQLLFLQARQQLLRKQDSLFIDLIRLANVRYRTGEGRLLEKTAAENQQQQTYLLLMQNQADMAIFQKQLQFLLHTADSLVLSEPVRKRIATVDNGKELTSKNPLLTFNQQQVEIAKKTIGLEKARLLPELTLGYFNQSLIGTQLINGQERFFDGSKRFQGFYLGLNIPLWSRPQNARIQAAKVQETINTTNFEFSQRAIETQYAQAVQDYVKFQTNLAYYENSALTTAKLLLDQAGKAYQTGEISYIEYTQSLSQSLITQANYLETINGYNQAINKIEFLLGNL